MNLPRLQLPWLRPLAFGLAGLLAGQTALPQETNAVPAGDSVPATAPETAASSANDFSAFRVISERNIFNPNRTRRSAQPEPERPRQPVVETFSLVGILSHDDRLVAFFDGSSSRYRKACKPEDTIAGYKLLAIGPNEVTLEADGKSVSLAVGNQLRREDEGPWQAAGAFSVSGESGRFTETTTGGAGVTADAAPGGSTPETSGASSGGDINDVLRRLREKRAQEMKNEKP